MFVIVAKFRIAPDQREAFGALIDRQARNSVELEPGCRYFDVCQDEADPNLFLLYEIYTDAKAFDTHRTYPHYKEFQAAIAGMVTDRQVMRLVRREPLA
jgi:quinol monooxygenase YgiN